VLASNLSEPRAQGPDPSAQRSFYDERGYVVFREAIAKEALAELAAKLYTTFEQAERSGGLFRGGGLLAGHLNCFPGEASRFSYDGLKTSGVLPFVAGISPKFAAAPRVGCNFNLPGSVAQNWHIDGSFERHFMIVNVAVIDTDLVNGAIDVLPGSHRRPRPYWRIAAERGFRSHERIEMRQGDVLVRSSRTWHRGMPNLSRKPRPMLGITFGEDCAPAGDPFLENGGAIAFFPNRFRTDALGRLRERTYVAAPGVHAALRFVRSLLGKDGYV
jgi:ectoine hydroxylase-related dioxygenase (phytanoyl-CoA dioxygenase family)